MMVWNLFLGSTTVVDVRDVLEAMVVVVNKY